jgi:hypothetical protein
VRAKLLVSEGILPAACLREKVFSVHLVAGAGGVRARAMDDASSGSKGLWRDDRPRLPKADSRQSHGASVGWFEISG